mmetsp:Transcript_28025/g.96906  ORF Transcript_28025/g.96906 Transcript_28025/m.96906 type:complete len:204 (-) Transcript_28025:1072-1683(-)
MPYCAAAYSRRNTTRSAGKVSSVGWLRPNMPPSATCTTPPNADPTLASASGSVGSVPDQSAAFWNTKATMRLRKTVVPMRAIIEPLSRTTLFTSRLPSSANCVRKLACLPSVGSGAVTSTRSLPEPSLPPSDASPAPASPPFSPPSPSAMAAPRFTHASCMRCSPAASCVCNVNSAKSAGLKCGAQWKPSVAKWRVMPSTGPS